MRILNENDFSKLVFDVAKDNPDVIDVNVFGFNVDLIFDSRDGMLLITNVVPLLLGTFAESCSLILPQKGRKEGHAFLRAVA